MTNLWQNEPQEYKYVLKYWRGAKLVSKEGMYEAYSPRAVTHYLRTRGPCANPNDVSDIQIWHGDRRCSDYEAGIGDIFPSAKSRQLVPTTGRQTSAYSAPAKEEQKPPPFAFPDEGFDKEEASG